MLQKTFGTSATRSCSALSRVLELTVLALVLTACSDEGTKAVPVAATSDSSASPPVSSGQGGAGTMASGTGASGTIARNSAGNGGGAGRPTVDEVDADAGATVPQDAAVPDGRDSAVSDASVPPEVACPSAALEPGETRAMLTHAGRTREYLIYVPRAHDKSKPVPLVLNFHGNTMTAAQQRDLSRMNEASDAKGFVVVYPQGISNGWNAGACCGEAQTSNVDDVGFARALVKAVQEQVCIDPHRIYAAGFSNGGRMSYRLGCEMADVFAALAPVAGTKSFPDLQNSPGCKPANPITLIDIMGSADSRVAAQPGQIAEWIAFNGCTDAPKETYRKGEHVCSTYSQCKDGTSVTYCVVDGGEHCWPGSYPCPLGNTSRPEEFSANELIWEVFERSTR